MYIFFNIIGLWTLEDMCQAYGSGNAHQEPSIQQKASVGQEEGSLLNPWDMMTHLMLRPTWFKRRRSVAGVLLGGGG